MRTPYTIEEIRSRTYKSRDAWWTVILVDPLASRLVQLVAGYRWVTPNRLTFLAFLLGLGSAACFARADYPWLVAGALLFHLSFVVDCMDGKIARLNGNGSVFGVWLDFIFDQLRVVICTIALSFGMYAATDKLIYLALGFGILIVDMLRYLNAWHIGKVKNAMRAAIAERTGANGPAKFVEELVREVPIDGDGDDLDDLDESAVDVSQEFRAKFSAFVRVRNYLVRHRIRIHLVSGIEFQMAAFVVGPLVGAVVLVPAIAGALLVAFELLLIYKLWMSTRSFERQLVKLGPPPTIPGQRASDDSRAESPVDRGANITTSA